MKKKYIKPLLVKGLSLECELPLAASIKGDGVQMEINSSGASQDADSRQGGSFWADTE